MTIQNLDGQLISNEKSVFGMALIEVLAEHRVSAISAGTVMVAKFNNALQFLFEVNFDIDVSKARGVSPMFPLQGSRVPLDRLPDGVTKSMINGKTVLLRDCRLPTALEYDRYLNSSAV